MRRHNSVHSGLWIGVLLWLGTCGCGSRDNTRPVQGSVLDFSGQPVIGVEITFWPKGKTRGTTAYPDPGSGIFRCRCQPGEYKVTVFPLAKGKGPGGPNGPVDGYIPSEPMGPGAEPKPSDFRCPIPGAYWKPELTQLTVTIPSQGTSDLKLQLTANGQ